MMGQTESVSAGDLRDWFPGHYSPTATELEEALRGATVVLDANVLLDFYRVLPDVRAEQINAFRAVGERLWIPNRVGQEFHERRFNAIRDQAALFKNCLEEFEGVRKQAFASLERLREACGAPQQSFSGATRAFAKAISRITDEVTAMRDSSDTSIESALRDDHILRAVDEMLKGKVGPPLSVEEFDRVSKDAEVRFKNSIPPGYCDAHKDKGRAVGDLVLWEQILKEAGSGSRSVLFVTRDNKEDWVRRDRQYRLGPRPELVAEMKDRAGVKFHLVRPSEFLALAQEYLGAQVSKETLEAVALNISDNSMSSVRTQGMRVSIARARTLDELIIRMQEDDEAPVEAYERAKELIARREQARRLVADAGHKIKLLKAKQKNVRDYLSTNPPQAAQVKVELAQVTDELEETRLRARGVHEQLQQVDSEINQFRRDLEGNVRRPASRD
ncbi:PIN-like domain-containing protein [Streptomyces sp. NPDC001073]